MSGFLYQLRTEAKVGEHVTIAGPWDYYGIVIRGPNENGCSLIRGTGLKEPEISGKIYSTFT